jgi:hypothetical protein
LSSAASAINFGQSVTLTGSVSGAAGVPTGSVTFYNGSALLGSATLNGSGNATLSASLLPAGTNYITAIYGGDTTYSPSVSALYPQIVNPVPIIFLGTNVVLQVSNSIVGTNYVLVSTTNLMAPITWTPIITNAGTGGPLTFTVPFNLSAPSMFFEYQFQ